MFFEETSMIASSGKAFTFGSDELTNCRYCPVIGYVGLMLANSIEGIYGG